MNTSLVVWAIPAPSSAQCPQTKGRIATISPPSFAALCRTRPWSSELPRRKFTSFTLAWRHGALALVPFEIATQARERCALCEIQQRERVGFRAASGWRTRRRLRPKSWSASSRAMNTQYRDMKATVAPRPCRASTSGERRQAFSGCGGGPPVGRLGSIGAVQQSMLYCEAVVSVRWFLALFQPARSCKQAASVARCDL